MAISRFWAIARVASFTSHSLAKQGSTYSSIRRHGSLAKAGLPSSLCRIYSHYKVPSRSHATLYKAEAKLCSSFHSRGFSVLSTKNCMTNHVQATWKRLYMHRSYDGLGSSPINMIARALSLSFQRSHLVPYVFALVVGEAALTQRTWADSEYFPTKDALYTRAQDGHIYFTSFILSIVDGLLLIFRVLQLLIYFSPVIVMAPLADSFGGEFRKTWVHLLQITFARAGPAFIKLGQWAATRPDIFPHDICTEMTKLHTKAPAHGFSYTKKTIEKAFGRKLSDIFENFEEEPVASGSIAQVHRASLKFRYPGQRLKPTVVAVKVRHPGVSESIRRDFVIVNLLAKISAFVPSLKRLRLDEIVPQFAVYMTCQVDLAREAAHLSRFIYNFRRWKDVSFPKPLYPLVHPAVLVETYEQGECVSHYVDEVEGNDRLKSALAHIGTHALLKMLLVDNFIHADMHPGNILVRVAPTKGSNKRIFKSKPHVIFIDVGMTAELSKNDRVNLLEFFKAVALRDGRTAAECTLRLSKQQKCPDPEGFIKEMEKSFSFWGTAEGDLVHPADCMHELLDQVRRYRVSIDGNVCTVMMTTLVLEGWQRKLDPDYDVMRTLQTLLFKVDWAKSLTYTIEGLMAP
ncbi:putative aarF domain-containing protein kinase [Acorus calamus]|uniref:AarF domain-containing protein kinase n=1 Tax=Acorus calamus TaxID=4465 RepID=A0AAV9DSM7_ACOCL|nr:putative aarF domain-containing protein kinase [Acorus calamus]